MDKVLIKSLYNEKNHRGFYIFHMFRKSYSVYLFIIAALASIYITISFTLNNPEAKQADLMIYWTFSLMVIIFVPSITIGKIKGIVRTQKKQRGDSYELIEVTKYKIIRKATNDDKKYIFGWEQFESAYEVEDCVYLYIDKERGLILDKKDIVEGDLQTLRKLLNNNIKKDKKGKPRFKIMYKD